MDKLCHISSQSTTGLFTRCKNTCFVVAIPVLLIFVDGISTDHLEITRLMGRDARLDTLSVDYYVEIAWLIGVP